MAAQPLVIRGYLVARADGSMRVTKSSVRLRLDEVAFKLTVTIPHQWGRVQPTTIDVELPEPPEARVTVGDPELGDFETDSEAGS